MEITRTVSNERYTEVVMGKLHSRICKASALMLAAVWIVTLTSADGAMTPAMHCERGHMPCCPRTGDCESCSPARCAEQVPEKAEAQGVWAKHGEAAANAPVRMEPSADSGPRPVRELTSGFRYEAPVFRLKDDLRI